MNNMSKSNHIPEEIKMRVLARKYIGWGTHQQIADALGISRFSVDRMYFKNASPEMQERVIIHAEQLLSRIERVRDKTLGAIEYQLDTGTLKGKDLIYAFDKTFDKAQILKGEPTQITQQANKGEQLALDYVKYLLDKGYDMPKALDALRAFSRLAEKGATDDVREQVAEKITQNPQLLLPA